MANILKTEIRWWPFYLFLGLGWLISGCVTGQPAPGSLLPVIEQKQQVIFVRGMAAYDGGKYSRAVRRFQELIARYPGSSFLMKAQWMLARTHERQGDWKRARLQYESLLSNFPQSPHVAEARLRIELLKELLRQEAQKKKSYPVFWGVEVTHTQSLLVSLQTYRSRGFNALLMDIEAPERDSVSAIVPMIHREGFYALALIRIDLVDLFRPAVQIELKRRLIEVAISGMDGVLFDGSVSSSHQGLPEEALKQFRRDFEIKRGQKEILEDPSLYWRWVGWRGREVVKILKETVTPIVKTRPVFYWGIIFPSEAITAPHQALASTGLDLLEAKRQGADYFGIRTGVDPSSRSLLKKAMELIGHPARIALVLPLSEEGLKQQTIKPSNHGILYLDD